MQYGRMGGRLGREPEFWCVPRLMLLPSAEPRETILLSQTWRLMFSPHTPEQQTEARHLEHPMKVNLASNVVGNCNYANCFLTVRKCLR